MERSKTYRGVVVCVADVLESQRGEDGEFGLPIAEKLVLALYNAGYLIKLDGKLPPNQNED